MADRPYRNALLSNMEVQLEEKEEGKNAEKVMVYQLFGDRRDGGEEDKATPVGDLEGAQGGNAKVGEEERDPLVKFVRNEYGFFEMIEDVEGADSSNDSDEGNNKEPVIISCVVCGCFGLETEFVAPEKKICCSVCVVVAAMASPFADDG